MRFNPLVSRSALVAVMGALALTASPATAQKRDKKKEKEAAEAAAAATGPQLTVSKEYAKVAKKIQDALAKKDFAAADAAIAEAEPAATKPDDKYYQARFRLDVALGTGNRPGQLAAVDTMIDSGLMPAADTARYNFFSGETSYFQKDYEKAIRRLTAAKAANSTGANLDLMIVDSHLRLNQLDQALAVGKAAIAAERAAGKVPLEDYYVRLARAMSEAKRRDDVLDILAMRVQDYPQTNIWNNTLRILMNGADEELSLDIYRLMKHAGAIKQRAEVEEYAALATKNGLPKEVLVAIDAGRSSKVIGAKDDKIDAIYNTQRDRAASDNLASMKADVAKGPSLANARLARNSADALYGYSEFASAAKLYQVALDKNDTAADVSMLRLGVNQYLAGDAAAARATLAKVGGTRQRLAGLWTTFIDQQTRAAAPAAAPAAAAPTTGR